MLSQSPAKSNVSPCDDCKQPIRFSSGSPGLTKKQKLLIWRRFPTISIAQFFTTMANPLPSLIRVTTAPAPIVRWKIPSRPMRNRCPIVHRPRTCSRSRSATSFERRHRVPTDEHGKLKSAQLAHQCAKRAQIKIKDEAVLKLRPEIKRVAERRHRQTGEAESGQVNWAVGKFKCAEPERQLVKQCSPLIVVFAKSRRSKPGSSVATGALPDSGSGRVNSMLRARS